MKAIKCVLMFYLLLSSADVFAVTYHGKNIDGKLFQCNVCKYPYPSGALIREWTNASCIFKNKTATLTLPENFKSNNFSTDPTVDITLDKEDYDSLWYMTGYSSGFNWVLDIKQPPKGTVQKAALCHFSDILK
ncbi:hypothetical protein D5R81_04035 [Parashewanella spongiae]|uniref:Uncharacterized protein n=1 Tax=Parashewanella spongiae TaxID=342950 RepID=A0A3A6TW97_9GAMM|nr:hypothetical protein [Parashewanella spongiae]MCL1077252.1 hypothetical protein [Parashewanella spongiae]RJY18669.1 hypothetical protein D5R81_04035 [Parashewanella spongiae]